MAEHAGYHEDTALLRAETLERHRAIVSLMEELEAVDWYDQRVDATADDELRAVLAHNRDEEKEHAAMTLEWLRRNDAGWDEALRTYLFTDVPITTVEAAAEGRLGAGTSGADRAGATGDLRIGSLHGEAPR
jgi:ferritin-like protein